MRYVLACLLAALLTLPLLAAETPGLPADVETAWLCRSRIGGWVPRIGRLSHASVILCPPGEFPFAVDAEGRVISNPSCQQYGTQPKHSHFLREDEPRVGATFEMAAVPAEVVRQRIATFERPWRWWFNCQHAAKEVTGAERGRRLTGENR